MGVEMKNRIISVKGSEVAIAVRYEQDYISLTDMVKAFDGGSALIEQWLKNKDAVLFLGVWEQPNNPVFNSNSPEFEGIRNKTRQNNFLLLRKKWIEAIAGTYLTTDLCALFVLEARIK
jgi:KilA-N domain